MKRRGISNMSAQLVERFDKAAQAHGWQRDQGTGQAVDNTLVEWQVSKSLLTRRIIRLEHQVRVLRIKK